MFFFCKVSFLIIVGTSCWFPPPLSLSPSPTPYIIHTHTHTHTHTSNTQFLDPCRTWILSFPVIILGLFSFDFILYTVKWFMSPKLLSNTLCNCLWFWSLSYVFPCCPDVNIAFLKVHLASFSDWNIVIFNKCYWFCYYYYYIFFPTNWFSLLWLFPFTLTSKLSLIPYLLDSPSYFKGNLKLPTFPTHKHSHTYSQTHMYI